MTIIRTTLIHPSRWKTELVDKNHGQDLRFHLTLPRLFQPELLHPLFKKTTEMTPMEYRLLHTHY